MPIIPRSQLEYPTENVTLVYLLAISKAQSGTWHNGHFVGLYCSDTFTDKAVAGLMKDTYSYITGRVSAIADEGSINDYYIKIISPNTTADFQICKYVSGVITALASEAVDLASGYAALCKISIAGSTINGYRVDMSTPKITLKRQKSLSNFLTILNHDGAWCLIVR